MRTSCRKQIRQSRTNVGALRRQSVGYIEDNRSMVDSEVLQAPSLNYDEQQHLMVMYRSASIISLANFNYAYTGGAHGNHATTYTSVDAVTGKKIALSSVLTPTGIKQLRKLLEKNFRKALNMGAAESLTEAGLFDNKIEPNKNFFLTATGIGFGFSPYEIGPYAMGEVIIFIPYSDFGNGINPSFKK
ncbi:MAG: DUF3298 domain-containing protein [Sphingobacteriales bacterium]|nr:MAG: DUF3298 domain-containing protein [Sphingobacteriales bacterium]